MHFGGGATESEQLLLKTYLENYEETFENEGVYGGDVDTYLKVTTDPITPVVFDEVNQQIEQGISLITFFGHASTDGFDQNIDNPDNWGNFGRYPVVLGLGCFAGDIHQPYDKCQRKICCVTRSGCNSLLSTVKIGFTNGLDKFTGRFL